ncbi:MAG TPA: winged helix-turn-helix domain-containing protein [Jiangellaceae bacterium]
MLFQFGDFQLDDQLLSLVGPAGPVHLEPQVYGVLHYLIVNRDRVVPKEELFDGVWGSRFVSESALTSRIKAARQAIGDDGRVQRFIKTMHGHGYRFVADVGTPPGSLQRRLTPMRSVPIGRDDDIKAVIELVRSATMVTITGAGGVGKTTLALAVAHQLQTEYADGAVLVDLTPIGPGGDIVFAVADGAGVEGEAAASADSLADHLAGRPVLLVLDNCEHVLEKSAELVVRIMARGPALRILATSREPLQIVGEHVWPLGPLADAGPQLFVERARAAEPRVAWDPADPQVIALCDRLDNLPLALELAAGQLRRFGLDELARHLGGRLTLLSRRAVGDSRRHATMEATIDWSYRLLDENGQRLLRYLSVFPASFDFPAVEALCPMLPSAATAGVFGDLVDKSLVVHDPRASRYRLLETIRVFARDRLDRAGEATEALERHRQHFVRHLGSPSRADRWMSARLAASHRRELDNTRQAFRHSIECGDLDSAVEIALSTSFLWRNGLGFTEGSLWVDALKASDLDARNDLWTRILRTDIGLGRGDFHEMSDATSSAEALVGATDDVAAQCLVAVYRAIVNLGESPSAAASLSRAMELAVESRESRLETLVEAFRAAADLAAENNDAARERLESLYHAASDDGYDRFITHWVGWTLALAERDATEATRWMDAQQDFLDRTGVVETWLTSFSAAIAQVIKGGDGLGHLRRALVLADREGYRADADCVLVLAYAEICADRFDAAAELMGTAIRSRFNTTAHYVLYRVVLERSIRKHLDQRRRAAAIARGRKRTAAQALAAHGISRFH